MNKMIIITQVADGDCIRMVVRDVPNEDVPAYIAELDDDVEWCMCQQLTVDDPEKVLQFGGADGSYYTYYPLQEWRA